jgi:hypothetical protein
MATSSYIQGRKKWNRPQAIIWSNNSGILDKDSGTLTIEGTEGEDFIILSDHNRSELSFSKQRIENRKRLINAHMRSYHIADKTNISWSWDMIPSRAFDDAPVFNLETGRPQSGLIQYIADGGAGGADVVKWYEDHPGSFYMFVSYDRLDKFESSPYLHLSQYSEIYEVFFSTFDYDIMKRGQGTHDFWNISVSVEEV